MNTAAPGECPFHELPRSAGTVLLHQGERPSAVMLLHSGQVVLRTVTPSGEEHTVGIRGAGSLLGMEAVTNDVTSFEARTLTNAVLFSIEPTVFRGWVNPNPVAGRRGADLRSAGEP